MFKNLSRPIRILCLSGLWVISIGFTIYYVRSQSPKHPTALRIAYVNIHKIGEELPATKQLQTDLEKILNTYHQQLEKTETSLKAEHQALLSAQKQPKSPQELQALEKAKAAFEAKVAQTQQDVETKQQSINQRHNKTMQKIRTILTNTVKEVANAEQIDIIISEQNIVYANPHLDFTEKVFAKVKTATDTIRIEQEKA